MLSSYLLYIKIGALAILVAAGAYFYVNYNRMQTKIKTQELVIEQQAQTIETLQKFSEIDVDTKKQKEEGKKIIESNDPQKIIDYFERLRKLSEGGGR